MKQVLFTFLVLFTAGLMAQEAPRDWWDLDITDDKFPGVSAQKAHKYLKGKSNQTVVVAVIDSGVDTEHEDLKDIIWTNPNEVPGNGIDDDRNGYIDDIHGWNFIGGADGRNINYENLEIVRIYNRLHKKYNNRNRDGLSKVERKEFDRYKEYEEIINKKREDLSPTATQYTSMMEGTNKLVKAIGKDVEDITIEDVNALESDDPQVSQIKMIIGRVTADGSSVADLYKQLEGALEYFDGQLKYNYNTEFDARDIVGDDPSDLNDRYYGNNDVIGPDASHGTHVAGIIAGVRDNELGVNGVGGPSVQIMSVRTVPNGDERDKDVANAIRYAVDNGASVINMSFGKGQSPYKDAVDEAVRYAQKHDVLLIHAAGNDGKELTLDNNYPNDMYERKGLFRPKGSKTWIEVGASSSSFDENLPASFSNYNKKYVDIFAPGRAIYSTTPDNNYDTFNGTSMAAPMVAGIAALVRSYFPDLKAEQVRSIILDSAIPVNLTVKRPGASDEDEKVNFSDLSATSGLANAYLAVMMAERTQGKKRRAAKRDASLVKY